MSGNPGRSRLGQVARFSREAEAPADPMAVLMEEIREDVERAIERLAGKEERR